MTVTLRRGTYEYVSATVTADVPLDAQTVAISIDGQETWLSATWVGDVGTKRKARTSSPLQFDVSGANYNVFVKVTDTPEIPVMHAGRIYVF